MEIYKRLKAIDYEGNQIKNIVARELIIPFITLLILPMGIIVELYGFI